jgi:cytochrome c biogenesis protein CcdA
MREGLGGPAPCHPEQESYHDEPLALEPTPPPPARRSLARHPRILFLALWLGLSGVLIVASVAAYITVPPPPTVSVPAGATVFYNEMCSDCGPYLRNELLPALEAEGLAPVVVKDYVNDLRFRAEMTALHDSLGVPPTLRSHLTTFVRTSRLVLLEGHVPAGLVSQALDGNATGAPARLLVYQDAMAGIVSYRAWAFSGSPREYSIAEPISTYYAWYTTQGGGSFESGPILPVVLVTGFLDGLNPCAFAVLLFFIAFLYAVRAPRNEVLRAIFLSDDPHLLAKVGAGLVIGLGGLTLLSFASPRIPLIARMPSRVWRKVRALLLKGSLPAATVAGVTVGLCTFPCSGGIYVAILGFLASRTSFLEGLGYLYLYNLMFILPLAATLAAVSNRQVALRAARWERLNAKTLKAVMAATMIGMGVLLLALVW